MAYRIFGGIGLALLGLSMVGVASVTIVAGICLIIAGVALLAGF